MNHQHEQLKFTFSSNCLKVNKDFIRKNFRPILKKNLNLKKYIYDTHLDLKYKNTIVKKVKEKLLK